jgi:Prephenate dehydratase
MPVVSYPGMEGAFTHQAACALFPEAELVSFEDWEAAAEAVASGNCDFAVFPLDNTLAGIVPLTQRLLLKYHLKIVREYPLTIRQHLLGVKGANLHDIRHVHSHSHAISQCRPFLNTHPDWQLIFSDSTAVSAAWVADKKDKAYAAIASEQAAEAYNLQVLKQDIHSGRNETLFGVLQKECQA